MLKKCYTAYTQKLASRLYFQPLFASLLQDIMMQQCFNYRMKYIFPHRNSASFHELVVI